MPPSRKKRRKGGIVVQEVDEQGGGGSSGSSFAAAEAEAAPASSVVHEGIFCDACATPGDASSFAQPIVGVRYARSEPECDLCEKCYRGQPKKLRRAFAAIEEPEEGLSFGGGGGGGDDGDGDDGDDLLEAALGVSSEDDAEEADGGGHGFVHGEMAVSKAQRTTAVRLPDVFSPKDIKKLLAMHEAVRPDCGVVLKKHGEGAQNWSTTFLQTDGIFASALPELRQKILDAASKVDAEQGWGLLAAAPALPQLRVVELHTVGPGGALPERKHYDHGSLVTVDIMLSPTENFEGGTLSTLESDGQLQAHAFEKGEATVL